MVLEAGALAAATDEILSQHNISSARSLDLLAGANGDAEGGGGKRAAKAARR